MPEEPDLKHIAWGRDADAKAFAQEILPKVQAHLKAIETLKTGT